jgi:GNAT superfamily N-acetyltransferase
VFTAPQPLLPTHHVADFDSGEPSLDDWLKRRAAKNQANGSSRTYVVCQGTAVVGFYSLAAGAIRHAEAPPRLKRNRPDPVPVLVLGRMAIASTHQQQGMGTALLNDAIHRAVLASEIAGVAALLVHAKSESAKRFYLSRGFIDSPVKPMTLCLMLGTVQQALNEG